MSVVVSNDAYTQEQWRIISQYSDGIISASEAVGKLMSTGLSEDDAREALGFSPIDY